jgi:hypothetical protein
MGLRLVQYFMLKYNGMQTKVSTEFPKLSESSQIWKNENIICKNISYEEIL